MGMTTNLDLLEALKMVECGMPPHAAGRRGTAAARHGWPAAMAARRPVMAERPPDARGSGWRWLRRRRQCERRAWGARGARGCRRGRREAATWVSLALLHVGLIGRGGEIDAVGSVRRPQGGSGRVVRGKAVADGSPGDGRSGGDASYTPWWAPARVTRALWAGHMMHACMRDRARYRQRCTGTPAVS